MVFQEKTYSVLLVSAQEKFNTAISELLPMTDYWPCVTVSSVSAAKRRLAEQNYDIVIINAPLPDDFGMRLAIDVCTESGAGVLLLVKSEMFESICAKTEPYGVVPLPKPTNRQMVSQALHVLRATRERMRRMEAKQATVEEKIEEIRLVNRAKWLLIECLSMTEGEAHRYIEKQSMDMRISRREVAENGGGGATPPCVPLAPFPQGVRRPA